MLLATCCHLISIPILIEALQSGPKNQVIRGPGPITPLMGPIYFRPFFKGPQKPYLQLVGAHFVPFLFHVFRAPQCVENTPKPWRSGSRITGVKLNGKDANWSATHLVTSGFYGLVGVFLKWWVSPTTMGFPTKNDHFGVLAEPESWRKQGINLFWFLWKPWKIDILKPTWEGLEGWWFYLKSCWWFFRSIWIFRGVHHFFNFWVVSIEPGFPNRWGSGISHKWWI